MAQKVSFNLLEFVEKWRQDNGFYHSHFQRYCKLCTSRLSTLRKELHLNALYGINQKSKDINKPIYFRLSDMENEQLQSLLYEMKLYEYILMQSERCISRSMQLRGIMQGSNTKSKRSIYRSLTSVQRNEKQRLGHAQERSETLLGLATRTGNLALRISARAYNQYVMGLASADVEDHFEAMKYFRVSQALTEHLVLKKLINENDVSTFTDANTALLKHSHFMASSFAGGDAEIIEQLNKDLTAPASENLLEPGALEAERAADLESHDEGASILIFVPHDDKNTDSLDGEVIKVRIPQVITRTLRKMKENELSLLSMDHKDDIQLIRDERKRLSQIIQQQDLYMAIPGVFSPPRKIKCQRIEKQSETSIRKAFQQITQTLNQIKRLQQATKAALDRPQAQDSLGLKQLYERLNQSRCRLQHEYSISVISWFIFGLYGVAPGAPGAISAQRAICELSQNILGLSLVTPQILHGQAQKNEKAAYMSILFNLATLATTKGNWIINFKDNQDQDKKAALLYRNSEIIKNTLQLLNKIQNVDLKPQDYDNCIIVDLKKLQPILETANALQQEKMNKQEPQLKLDDTPGLIPPPIPDTIQIDCIPFELQFDDIFEANVEFTDTKYVYGLDKASSSKKDSSSQAKGKGEQKAKDVKNEKFDQNNENNDKDDKEAAPEQQQKKKGILGRLFGF